MSPPVGLLRPARSLHGSVRNDRRWSDLLVLWCRGLPSLACPRRRPTLDSRHGGVNAARAILCGSDARADLPGRARQRGRPADPAAPAAGRRDPGRPPVGGRPPAVLPAPRPGARRVAQHRGAGLPGAGRRGAADLARARRLLRQRRDGDRAGRGRPAAGRAGGGQAAGRLVAPPAGPAVGAAADHQAEELAALSLSLRLRPGRPQPVSGRRLAHLLAPGARPDLDPQLDRGQPGRGRSAADRGGAHAGAAAPRHQGLAGPDPDHHGRAERALPGRPAARGPRGYGRLRGPRLCRRAQHLRPRRCRAPAGAGGRRGDRREADRRRLRRRLRDAEPPVADHRDPAARAAGRPARIRRQERLLRDRGRLRGRDQLRQQPDHGAQVHGPERQRDLRRLLLQAPGAGPQDRLSGRGRGPD